MGRRRNREAPTAPVRRAYGHPAAKVLLAIDGSAEADLASLVAIEQAETTGY